jgi:hypothetical protein
LGYQQLLCKKFLTSGLKAGFTIVTNLKSELTAIGTNLQSVLTLSTLPTQKHDPFLKDHLEHPHVRNAINKKQQQQKTYLRGIRSTTNGNRAYVVVQRLEATRERDKHSQQNIPRLVYPPGFSVVGKHLRIKHAGNTLTKHLYVCAKHR